MPAWPSVLRSINDFSPFIFAIVIPLAYPFMVPLGLHWPINAIMLLNIQTLGYDYIQGPMGAWNFACFGATAGVLCLAWRERDVADAADRDRRAGRRPARRHLRAVPLRHPPAVQADLPAACWSAVWSAASSSASAAALKTSAFVFTSLLTIPAFSNIPLYVAAITAAFFTSMLLVIFLDYRTKEERARARGEELALAEVGVGAEQASQAQQWVDALGGPKNIVSVAQVAQTRVRVELKDSSVVDKEALAAAGLPGVVQVGPQVWHLVAGFDSDILATAMSREMMPVPVG